MQWADSATWDTLEHLVPQLDQDHILICLTIRAEDKSKDVMDRRRRLSRDERFGEISLQRLTRAELEQWLAAASRGQELGRELLPVLYRHTEGNPFLVVQVLRALVEEGRDPVRRRAVDLEADVGAAPARRRERPDGAPTRSPSRSARAIFSRRRR